ncbi:hypothetical protein [Phnomibacter ginsenosidimutans]|uniref:PKD domain-containing protein n=1 Tax=Phnomibacter ginsenosidimutans TaxID=2676868 RepID=A0A6I6G9G2_9BACT|nr:hypothetical protein [Phnomibacter ginsenosidimutans]QGW29446.1 hypothetical protein GLV81_16235 [Phnomibacter ginsenosidimutans]
MTLKYITRFALAIVVMGMLLSSKCSKDPIPAVPDPCADITAFKADFVMLEEVGDTSFQVFDSAIINRFITFKAVGQYDSVKWEIGNSQNVFKKNSVSLYFNVLENRIPVKFTGYNAKGGNCFPATPSVQTVTKYLTIVPVTLASAIGKFQGYNIDNPADTFTVILQRSPYFLYLKNLPKGCNGYINPSEGSTQYNFGVEAAQGFNGFVSKEPTAWMCGKLEARGFLVNRDTLIVHYKNWPLIKDRTPDSWFEWATEPVSKTFKGVRIR